jgi:coproporphyrinogen III oxidase
LTLKDACDKYDLSYYPRFKQECDKYFYNTHRKEHRGVGGIFFDDMDTPNRESVFGLVKSLGDAVLPSYLPILENNMAKEYTDAQREWQLLRRGKHVEFILVYDRGTKFSLQMPNAPVESILMSLPLHSVCI